MKHSKKVSRTVSCIWCSWPSISSWSCGASFFSLSNILNSLNTQDKHETQGLKPKQHERNQKLNRITLMLPTPAWVSSLASYCPYGSSLNTFAELYVLFAVILLMCVKTYRSTHKSCSAHEILIINTSAKRGEVISILCKMINGGGHQFLEA